MHAAIESIIKDWPRNPRESAKRLVDYYGEPDEYTPSQLVWFRTGDGWKRTVLSRTEVPHDFPAHHTDFLEQWIDYQVPVDMYSKLAEYDGSVIVERTKGELSARCDKEAMNFLALNLANDVATGRRTVAEARQEYARQATAFMSGQPAPYTEGLKFAVSKGGTADADSPATPGRP